MHCKEVCFFVLTSINAMLDIIISAETLICHIKSCTVQVMMEMLLGGCGSGFW